MLITCAPSLLVHWMGWECPIGSGEARAPARRRTPSARPTDRRNTAEAPPSSESLRGGEGRGRGYEGKGREGREREVRPSNEVGGSSAIVSDENTHRQMPKMGNVVRHMIMRKLNAEETVEKSARSPHNGWQHISDVIFFPYRTK